MRSLSKALSLDSASLRGKAQFLTFFMYVCMNSLNDSLIKSKTGAEKRPDPRKTKFGSGNAIESGVAELLLGHYLVKLRVKPLSKAHERFWLT